ncbi:MAG: hypothetical protein MUE85_11325 [Microscillaceae bacterium]|jgi:hypothetical protein|nr:hypothetical protein [Microscillaceae bacterium]
MMKQLSIVLIFLLFATVIQAQTSFEIKSKGASKEQYVPIKGYEITGAKEYTYIFSEQSTYHIKIEDANNKPVLLKIYNKDKKEIFSNFKNQKYYDEISFECPRTEMYYLKVEPVSN